MIDKATINKIIETAHIVDVVSDFVSLKRAGANFKGLCPFHDDRTPSFMVSPAKNICHCFACGEGGSPLNFVMKHEQCSYTEALRYLAKKYGIPIQERAQTEGEKQAESDRESMLIVNEWANKWFQSQLYDSPQGQAIGLAYFRTRGFRDDILKKFQVGFCPDLGDNGLWKQAIAHGFQEKYLINTPHEKDIRQSVGTGLCIKRDDNGKLRDRFRNRVIWPIFSRSGRVAGFGGRVLDQATKGVNVKYLNSPESMVYSKSYELFGLHQAKMAISKKDHCFLVEGYTDVMAMHQNGIENVVASSGTALTTGQISIIHRLTNNLTIIYDGDNAGIKASKRGIDLILKAGMNVKLLLLPDGDDPDSFSRKCSQSEFQQYIETHQVDFLHYQANLLNQEGQTDPLKKSESINSMVTSIAMIPNEITRAVYIREAARMTLLDERLIANAVSKQLKVQAENTLKEKEIQERQAKSATNQTEGHTTANVTSSLQTTELATPQGNTPKKNTQKEALLVQMIIRFGEKKVFLIETEEGEEKWFTIIEYIYYNLQQDELSFTNPLYQQILIEGMEHLGDENFNAETYFNNHPDTQISQLAYVMSTDNEVVSRYYKDADEKGDAASKMLAEQVEHILAELKLAIIRQELKDIWLKTKDPQIVQDKEQYRNLLQQFKEKKSIELLLAKHCGDRVIG